VDPEINRTNKTAWGRNIFGYSLETPVGAVLILTFIIAATINLDRAPPLWWDEGWTLSVARNWAERGHYSRLLAGQLVSPGFEASLPLTAGVALAFHLLGVGVYQARLVVVGFTLGTLALIYCLTRRLYNPLVALVTLAVLVFMPAYPGLHPLFIGRQVLGEMPALFFLLGGYACFLLVPRWPLRALTLTTFLWAIALITKLQILPFWACAVVIPSLLLARKRNWKSTAHFGMAIVGSLFLSRLLIWLWQFFLHLQTAPLTPISGLYQVTAVVVSLPARFFALIVIFLFGVPTLLGLSYGLWSFVRNKDRFQTHADALRLSLLVLAGSWFCWYVTFSVGWIRYFFPATFIGSIFVAAMLCDLTDRFSFSFTVRQGVSAFRHFRFDRQSLGGLIVIALIATSVPRTLIMLYKTYVSDADASVQEVAHFLNTQTTPGALVETYDSELFFLLERPYHYPPDPVVIELNHRTFLYEDDVSISYDPLAANPDFLVVGPQSKQWRLYNQVLKTGAFRLLRTYTRYELYERVR
jgi:hypothetical protein